MSLGEQSSLSNVLLASNREKLWHQMRLDLASYVPQIAQNQLLMCCACGRFLPQENFDLEHIVPQQALKLDPIEVQNDPTTPKNVRAGILLLCKKPLRVKGMTLYRNGCNSWKGRFYDKPIAELISGKALQSGTTTLHLVAALIVGYLAMVAEFGYSVVLMRTGRIMREQFFMPGKFHPEVPLRSQLVLGGQMPTEIGAKIWGDPFSFGLDGPDSCVVATRNFVVHVPISRDPRQRVSTRLIVPERYRPMRPDFRTFFD